MIPSTCSAHTQKTGVQQARGWTCRAWSFLNIHKDIDIRAQYTVLYTVLFWIFRIFSIYNFVTLGQGPGYFNILKDIQKFKFNIPNIFWIFTIFRIFEFEYPQLFLDIRNFLDIQLCDIGRCPRTLEYP